LGWVAPSTNVDSEMVCKYKTALRAPISDIPNEITFEFSHFKFEFFEKS
jgi:hypothetical protein